MGNWEGQTIWGQDWKEEVQLRVCRKLGDTLVVECLPNIYKALGLIPSILGVGVGLLSSRSDSGLH
jgi:hypothetical protein